MVITDPPGCEIRCSTNLQSIRGCWECLWPNMAILGQKWPFLSTFWAQKRHFRVFLMVITDPPGCEIICSTMSNQSSTYLGSLGLPMAQYGNFRSFWGVLGPPSAIFGGQKGSKLTPPDVKYNVQPCSTNVQPIWGRWDCLWPNMAILSHKMAIKYGK